MTPTAERQRRIRFVARHPGPLGGFFRRLAKRKPRQVALMALARKLVTVAFLMLKNGEPYRYASPRLMGEKFAKLRSKHRPRNAATEDSRTLRAAARRGLSDVYAAAGLPPTPDPEKLPEGERRMLQDRQLTDFVDRLHRPSASEGPSRQTAHPED